jgi:hypothetical protein
MRLRRCCWCGHNTPAQYEHDDAMTSYSGKFRLCQLSDFPKLPAMRWFIQSLIPRYGITLIYGEAKIGKKTFIGMSLACAIATGTNWCGFPTIKGKVLYISGEGFYGLLRRQAAWEHLHGITIGNDLRFLREPINFYDENEVKAALTALKTQDFIPDFVIIDTLAKSMSGGKENATEDMSTVFKQIDLFRANVANDISIAIIHHTGKDGLNYRGSSVIKGAVDALIMTKADNLEISLTSKGYKDAADFQPFKVRCQPVNVDTEDGLEEVLVVKERVLPQTKDEPVEMKEQHAKTLVQIIIQFFPDGATNTQLEQQSGMSDTTFKRALGYAREQKWLIGGGGRGLPYNLNPNKCWQQSGPTSGPVHPFLKGVDPSGPYEVGSVDPSWTQVGPLDPSASCKNVDTTSNNKNLNETELDLAAEALKQLAVKKKSLAS